MIIKRLQIKNYLIFKDVDLDLSGVKLVSIIGQFARDRRRSNGSGKSALVEAIRYALFDKARSNKTRSIRSGQKTSTVILEFVVGSDTIKVQRIYGGMNQSKLWVNGREAGDKIAVVNDVIKSYIGVDSELFDLIYFFKQRDQFGFTEATPSDRKNALSKVFRMEMIDKCLEVAKARHKDAQAASQRADGWITGVKAKLAAQPPHAHLVEVALETSAKVANALLMHSLHTERSDELVQHISSFEKEVADFERNVAAVVVQVEREYEAAQICSTDIARLKSESQRDSGMLDGIKNNCKRFEDELATLGEIDHESVSSQLKELIYQSSEIELVRGEAKARCAHFRGDDNLNGLAGEYCPKCYQVVPVEHVEKVKAERKKNLEEAMRLSFQYDQQLNSVKESITLCRDNLDKHSQIQSLTAQLKQSKDYLRSLQSAERERNKRIVELEKKRDDHLAKHSVMSQQVDGDEIHAMRQRFKERLGALITMQGVNTQELKKYSELIVSTEGQHVISERNIKENEDLQKDLAKALESGQLSDQETTVYSHLVHAFGKNGMQAILIENIVGVIESFANEILEQMQTQFAVAMRTQKSTVAGDVKETLDIIVYDNGVEKPFENYSGGEQTLVNLAIRLALSKIISSLHGVQLQSLFLDEVLAELDEVNREEAIKVVSYLSRAFQQVFIISHEDGIKSIIDDTITITRHQSHSDVTWKSTKTA